MLGYYYWWSLCAIDLNLSSIARCSMSRYVNLASNGSINLDIPDTEFLGLKNSELYYCYCDLEFVAKV